MNTQHTPGPWDVIDTTVFALDRTGTVNRFSALMQHGYVERAQGFSKAEYTQTAELEANARLIAAAPELLDAGERLVEEAKAGKGVSADALNQMLDAIAKARGAS